MNLKIKRKLENLSNEINEIHSLIKLVGEHFNCKRFKDNTSLDHFSMKRYFNEYGDTLYVAQKMVSKIEKDILNMIEDMIKEDDKNVATSK